jgi:hypothetical protein
MARRLFRFIFGRTVPILVILFLLNSGISTRVFADTISLSVDAAVGVYGGDIDLHADLSDGGSDLNDKSISFYLDGVYVGHDDTDYFGNATLHNVSLEEVGVGSHTIRAEYHNHQINISGTASLIVSPKQLTCNITIANKVYDGTLEATITNRTLSGVEGTDDVSATGGIALFNNKNVGTNKPVTVSGLSLIGASTDNYTVRAATSIRASISNRNLSITADSQSKVYGDPDPVFTYQITSGNLIIPDSLSGSLQRVTGESVGNYGIQIGTLSAGSNYNISFAAATLEIAKATPVFSALGGPTISAGTTPTILGGILKSGALIPSGEVSITLNGVAQSSPIDSSGRFTSSFVTNSLTYSGSPYALTYSYGGDQNFNSVSDSSQKLIVNTSSASIILSNLNKTYDGNPKTVDVTTNPPGLTANITYNGSTTAPVNVGSYEVKGTIIDSSYNGETTATLVINKATPVFSSLSGPSISAGTTPTILEGILKSGTLIPSGEVSITLNGVAQSSPIDSIGHFTYSFVTNGLKNSGSPYALTYSYGGDQNFEGVTDSSQRLTIISQTRGGAGGGVGGGSNQSSVVAIAGFESDKVLSINVYGKVKNEVQLKSTDGKVSLNILKNTDLRTSNNGQLTTLSIAPFGSVPESSPGTVVLLAYNFGPEGATFNPPLTLTMSYDPQGMTDNQQQQLYICWWNGTKWSGLDSTVDTTYHTISTQVSHFSVYALTRQILVSEPVISLTPVSTALATPESVPAESIASILVSTTTTEVQETQNPELTSKPTSIPTTVSVLEQPANSSDIMKLPWPILVAFYFIIFWIAIALTVLTVMIITKRKRARN